MVSLSSAVPDPLLSALILPVAGDTESVQSKVSTESGTNNKSLDEAVPERYDAFRYLITCLD